jgi:hypothetical protein
MRMSEAIALDVVNRFLQPNHEKELGTVSLSKTYLMMLLELAAIDGYYKHAKLAHEVLHEIR